MTEPRLDHKQIKPEQLAALSEFIRSQSEYTLSPDEAFWAAIDFYKEALSIIRTQSVPAPHKKSISIDTNVLIAELIRYMEQSGKGATEIGRELNLSRAAVTLWRSGKGRPGKKARVRLAKYLADHSNNYP